MPYRHSHTIEHEELDGEFQINGITVNAIVTFTVDFDVRMDSWDYPDGANTRRSQRAVDAHEVTMELEDIALYDKEGNEIEANDEVRRAILKTISVEDYFERLLDSI